MQNNYYINAGLSIAYNVGADDYMDFVQTLGVRIVIHNQNETVLPDAAGFNLPSDYRSAVALTQVIFNKRVFFPVIEEKVF